MNINRCLQARGRPAVAGVLASIIMFAMLFVVIVGYFIYVNQGTLSTIKAQQGRNEAAVQASSEMLSMQVGLSTVKDPWGKTGDLWLRITNTGETPSTLLYIYVVNVASGRVASTSQVTPGSQLLSIYSTPLKGDLNLSLPLTIPPGMSSALMTGCTKTVGCDIAISQAAYKYTISSPVLVSVVTQDGNTFSAPYPPVTTATTEATTSAVTTVVYSTETGANPGGAILVVQMVATPPQTFQCSHCVNDTVTVYNYGSMPVSGVSLSPSVPLAQYTGTLQLNSKGPCVLAQGETTTIPGYTFSGPVPNIVYTCTYSANPNGFGGFVSFTGSATGTYNSLPTTSGVALSNTIQIGGPVSVLNQGPFSLNFFYFKYSACTNAPTGGSYSPACTTTPSPVTLGSLKTASVLTGSSSYYVAFYAQITNNFNVSLPILPYTYFLTDPTLGGESPFYIVGNPSSLPYIPNYKPGGNGIPTLTPYPSSCTAASTSACINLAPGQTVTLTFAACDITSTYWDWAGSAYGRSFDSGNNCTTNPPDFQTNEATWVDIVISFLYKGQVYDQGIPFVGIKVN